MDYRMVPEKMFCNLNGLEIGGLHNPLIYKNSNMEYLDILNENEATDVFYELELEAKDFSRVQYVGDVSATEVFKITNKKFDFIIANHVIEHVANPILFVKNMLTGINKDGYLIISAPNKEHTFDKNRTLTRFEHLLAEYHLDTLEVDNDHYIDFLINVHPETLSSKETFNNALLHVKKRREHAHVWDDKTFKEFLLKTMNILKQDYHIVFEHFGEEYFCVLRISNEEIIKSNNFEIYILKQLYDSRIDLQKEFNLENKNLDDFKRFHEWVLQTASGDNKDNDRIIISQYYNIYLEMGFDLFCKNLMR